MKLLIDMNLSPRWVGFLADEGIIAAHWSDIGAKDAPDSEIMAYAKAEDYVVLTHDLDFGAILAATQGDKPSSCVMRAVQCSGAHCLELMRMACRAMGKAQRLPPYEPHAADNATLIRPTAVQSLSHRYGQERTPVPAQESSTCSPRSTR